MKKKILSLCLIAIIATMAIAGASLAYLTDTDEAENVFEVGNVQIKLVEEQRKLDEDGNKTTELEDFEDYKVLLPLVGSAQADKDAIGLPMAANYVDKIVTVDNVGKNAAYVRIIVAVPSALDYSDGPLHWNLGNKYNGATTETYNAEVKWECVAEKTDVNGIFCNIYTFTYQTAVESSESTPFAAIVGFYLDPSVDNYVDDEGNIVYTYKGNDVDYDFSAGVTVPVFAQAVQAAGFETADSAFTAAALPTNPWAE